jgi:hypothetical protein
MCEAATATLPHMPRCYQKHQAAQRDLILWQLAYRHFHLGQDHSIQFRFDKLSTRKYPLAAVPWATVARFGLPIAHRQESSHPRIQDIWVSKAGCSSSVACDALNKLVEPEAVASINQAESRGLCIDGRHLFSSVVALGANHVIGGSSHETGNPSLPTQ